MATETIHETPPLYHAPGAQSSVPTSEKAPIFPQPTVANPNEVEGPQVDPNVPHDGRDVATIAQQYRDQLFAQCAQGNHERKSEFGVFGIIMAIMCFPIGLICLFADKKEKCARCGVLLEKKN